MTRAKWILAGALVLILATVAAVCAFQRHRLPKEEVKLTATYAADTSTLRTVRLSHDRTLAGKEPMPREQARGIVHSERVAADKVIATGEKRVANLREQLRPARLKLFGEIDYGALDSKPLLEGSVNARVGAELLIRRGTYVRGYVEQKLVDLGDQASPTRSYHVAIRQELKIF